MSFTRRLQLRIPQDDGQVTFGVMACLCSCLLLIPFGKEPVFGAPVFNPQNGHYYEFIEMPPETNWDFARLAAGQMTFTTESGEELLGYLATVTSLEEELFIQELVTAEPRNIWLGGSDSHTEGEWRWVTGPEGDEENGLGRLFWRNRPPVEGQFSNWRPREPNNVGNEDFLSMNPGLDIAEFGWNDTLHQPFPRRDNDAISGFLVEFGDFFENPIELIAGDYNQDERLDALDIERLAEAIRAGNGNVDLFDENTDGHVDFRDLVVWVHDYANTFFGDANLDREFNAGDLVDVFVAGKYEDSIAMNSTWGEGDWNADGDFDSSDFVVAFVDGGFEKGARVGSFVVPESIGISLPGLFGLIVFARRFCRVQDRVSRL